MKWTGALLLFTATTAHSFTGNDLHRMMQDKESGAKLASLAYVRGFVDGSIATVISGSKNSQPPAWMFCMPSAATTDQAVDIVRNHLAAAPGARHLDAAVLTSIALSNAWPCK